MRFTKDSQLAFLRIPHLPMVIREAFAVYNKDEPVESLGSLTISELAERAHLPLEGVTTRLRSLETMAETAEISCEELSALLAKKSKNLYLLDVRQEWEFDLCHIENSKLMAKLDLAQIFPGLKELEVITICHHGIRSLSAAFYLQEAGLPNVRSLQGGLDQWALTVDREMPRY